MPKGKRTKWITTSEAAEILGISTQAVVQRIKRGAITGRAKDNRWWVNEHELGGAKQSKRNPTPKDDTADLVKGAMDAVMAEFKSMQKKLDKIRAILEED